MTAQFDDMVDRRVFYAGDTIISEGQFGTEMFVIESGTVEIWKGPEDNRLILNKIGPGCVFGEMALIDEKPRMASATAVDQVVCKTISKQLFLRNMAKLDPFMKRIVDVLTINVRSFSTQLDQKDEI